MCPRNREKMPLCSLALAGVALIGVALAGAVKDGSLLRPSPSGGRELFLLSDGGGLAKFASLLTLLAVLVLCPWMGTMNRFSELLFRLWARF